MLVVSNQRLICVHVVDEANLIPVEALLLCSVKCSAVLDDLETMWQAASKDNRRMQETVRRTDRKLQQHLHLCGRLSGDVKTAGDAPGAVTDYDI